MTRPATRTTVAGVRAGMVGLAVLAAALLVPGQPADAHFQTIAFSNVTVAGDQVTWDLYLDPYHVRSLVAIDDDGNGTITGEEIAANAAPLRDLGREAIRVSRGGTAVGPSVDRVELVAAGEVVLPDRWRPVEDFPLIHLEARFVLPSGEGDPRLEYPLLDRDDVDLHQNVTVVSTAGTDYLHVFDPDAAPLVVDAALAPAVPAVPTGARAAVVGAGLGVAVVVVLRRRSRPGNAVVTGSGGARGREATGRS